MGLFGRKKKDDEELEELEAIEAEEQRKINLENRRLKKKLKDLAPENSSGRKEPIKPWGKKERLIVFGFFLFTTLSATVMFLFSHEYKFPGLPKITIKGINIENPFSEKVIEIGQKKTGTNNDDKAQAAIALFDINTRPLSGIYGFLVIRLNDGASYGVSSDTKFQGASLLKLPLMVLMYQMSERGEIDLDTKYTLKESDKIKGSGVLYAARAGTEYSYRQLAEFMGKNSDRTAYKVMKDIIGEGKLIGFITEVGMSKTDINTGETTPSDYGKLLYQLWDGNLVNLTDRDEILESLTDTIYESWITAGVPTSVKVAHKFGTDEAVMADGGIILTKNPYILVIMGQGITTRDADKVFPEISKGIYRIETDDY